MTLRANPRGSFTDSAGMAISADVRSPALDYLSVQVHADVVLRGQLEAHDRAPAKEGFAIHLVGRHQVDQPVVDARPGFSAWVTHSSIEYRRFRPGLQA